MDDSPDITRPIGHAPDATTSCLIDVGTMSVAVRNVPCRTSASGPIVWGGDMLRAELSAASALVDRGLLSGAGFRLMRKAIGLRAFEAGELLDVTATTVSRWETGECVVPRLAWAVMAAIVRGRLGEPVDMTGVLRSVATTADVGGTIEVDFHRRDV